MKFSPDEAIVQVSLERADAGVVISVHDRGIGIPRNEQGEIFGRFVRGRGALARGIKGTGLGLAIVSHIVKAHGGTVRVESVEGAGSTFTIVLPDADSSAGVALPTGVRSSVLSSKS